MEQQQYKKEIGLGSAGIICGCGDEGNWKNVNVMNHGI